jgi:hypothetical protein
MAKNAYSVGKKEKPVDPERTGKVGYAPEGIFRPGICVSESRTKRIDAAEPTTSLKEFAW